MTYGPLVVFRLAERELGFPLTSVSSILPMVAVTPIPESTPWLPGVINLHGSALPVMELRRRLGLPPREPDPDPDAAIIVMESPERAPLGVIVDHVLRVVTLSPDEISPVDPLSGDDHIVEALGREGTSLLPILSVARLMSETADLHLPENIG